MMEKINLKDSELIQLIQAGSIDDYAILIKRYQSKLQSALCSHCTNRIQIKYYLHEAFVKAYSNLHKFNPVYPFFPWLKMIAINLLRDDIRGQKTLSDEAKEILIQNLYAENNSEEELGALKECLSSLEETQRDLIKLRYWGEMSIHDLSEKTERNPSALKMQILRIRESLKDCIKGKVSYG